VLEALESAKNQIYKNIELIISDDCSSDNTVEICKKWIEENKSRFINTKIIKAKVNQGIPANCNQGIKIAEGEWIRIIAGDDALIFESTKKYIDYINIPNNKNIEVLHSNAQWYNGNFSDENKLRVRPLDHYKLNEPSATAEEQFQILLRSNKVSAGTIFIKREIFHRIGLYDEEPRLWEDRPMLLKMTQNGIKLHYLDFLSLKYRKHATSIQSIQSKKYLSDYFIIKNTYYYKHYLQYLPFFERFVKTVILKRIIWFDKLNLNKNQFLNIMIFKFFGFPWTHISNWYKKKYL
jgi:alpha-1,3-rhamnosyltransferase